MFKFMEMCINDIDQRQDRILPCILTSERQHTEYEPHDYGFLGSSGLVTAGAGVAAAALASVSRIS